MPEYKYVSLPTVGKQVRSERVDEYASIELNALCASEGWTVVNVVRPMNIGPIGFLLVR